MRNLIRGSLVGGALALLAGAVACSVSGNDVAHEAVGRTSAALTSPYAADPVTVGIYGGATGALDIAWFDTNSGPPWHDPVPLSDPSVTEAGGGGGVAVLRQSTNVITALFFDQNGALEETSLDVTSGVGWPKPHAITGNGVAPPGANIAMGNEGNGVVTALFFDKNGVLSREDFTSGDQHQGPTAMSSPYLAPAGSWIAMANQTGSVLSAVYVDGAGALDVSWIDVATTNQWAGPSMISPHYYGKPGGGVALAKQTDSVLTALFVDLYGYLNVAWLNVDGPGPWAGPQRISTAPFAQAGAGIAMVKQDDVVLAALVVDSNGALDIAWLNTDGANPQWAGPQPLQGTTGLYDPGAFVSMVNQSTTITSALLPDTNGAVNLFWLDESVPGAQWAGPKVLTASGATTKNAVVAMGKHLEKACGGHGSQCCSQTGCDSTTDVCNGPGGLGIHPGNTCQCGGEGDTCCAGNGCGPNLACVPTPATGFGGHVCTCGWQGQPCCVGPTLQGYYQRACEPDFECSSGGTCVCGGPGQVCCAGNTCNDGKACTNDAQGVPRCPVPPPPCGSNGQTCCQGNTCPGGSNLTCSGGRCGPKNTTCSGAAATSSAQAWPVGIKHADTGCAWGLVGEYANSYAEASSCATKANYLSVAMPLGELWSTHPFAQWLAGDCTPITVEAFDDADAQTCASFTCVNCDSVVPGTCPTGHAPVTSCTGQGMNCGETMDGAGNVLACGSCTAPQTCGGGGAPGLCGCTPLTCASAGATCGTLSDGCGGTLSCGTCGSGTTCNAQNQCAVCTAATTCAAAGAECGVASDGCGGTLSCGTCPAGERCIKNQCFERLPPPPPHGGGPGGNL
jgi:hypothetical protein